jgi:hypothetical protein
MNTKLNMSSICIFVIAVTFISASVQAETRTLRPMKPMTLVEGKQTYTIKGRDFYMEAKNYGFNTTAHEKSFGSNCKVNDFINENALALEAGRWQGMPGSKCDFNVFKGQTLKNGFVFKSYRGQKKVNGKANINMTSSPASGGNSIKFTFHGWADPGLGQHDNEAYYMFTEFVLEGPTNRDWRDALR